MELLTHINNVEVFVKRSNKRSSVAIEVNNKHVRLLAPDIVSNDYLLSVVRKKRPWIKRKLTERSLESELLPIYQDGGKSYFKGELYTIATIANSEPFSLTVDHEKQQFKVNLNTNSNTHLNTSQIIQALLEQYYRQQALSYFTEQTQTLAEKYQIDYLNVTVKSYKRRWGCCYSDGKILYNFHLIKSAKEVMDYVITHELCHVTHPNHSKEYWQLVEKHMPNYKAPHNWLKRFGDYLLS